MNDPNPEGRLVVGDKCRAGWKDIGSPNGPAPAAIDPLPVPRGSVNLAFISQFVEIPDDGMMWSLRWSIRCVRRRWPSMSYRVLTARSRP